VLTSLGRVTVRRRYWSCAGCALGSYAVDALLGLEDYLSPRLQRLSCLAGADRSFRQAQQHVHEFCGVAVGEETLRQACLEEGRRLQAHRQELAVEPSFAAAVGVCECQTDATKVNTVVGWKDLKIAAFAKRPVGEAATPAEWATRQLPAPTARVLWSGVAPNEEFLRTWRPWAVRVGLPDPAAVTVLADGAEWIWNDAASQFPGAMGVLDVFHAVEHLAATGKQIFGEGSAEAAAWTERGRQQLLQDGWAGLCVHLNQTLAEDNGSVRQEAVDGLTGYFAKHTAHVNYAGRLAEGLSIGSGLIEGAAKTLGRRLKQSGARWRIDNVNAMAELCSVRHSTYWDLYWVSRN
jgi:hypothetical protein